LASVRSTLARVVKWVAGERTAVPHLHFLGSLGRRIDRVPTLRDRLWRLEAATLERVWSALGAGGPDIVSARGERLGRLLGPRLRKQRHVLSNLATAFPDWPAVRVEAMAARVWGAVGRTMLEYACLGQIGDPAAGRVRVVDLGGLDHVRRTGRPGIFRTPSGQLEHAAGGRRARRSPPHRGLPASEQPPDRGADDRLARRPRLRLRRGGRGRAGCRASCSRGAASGS
jgi:hypothetical protein